MLKERKKIVDWYFTQKKRCKKFKSLNDIIIINNNNNNN